MKKKSNLNNFRKQGMQLLFKPCTYSLCTIQNAELLSFFSIKKNKQRETEQILKKDIVIAFAAMCDGCKPAILAGTGRELKFNYETDIVISPNLLILYNKSIYLWKNELS